MSAVYALYVWLRLPETKGYEISEIESILHHTEWVPFESAPPAATDADAEREAAQRAAARGGVELHPRSGHAAAQIHGAGMMGTTAGGGGGVEGKAPGSPRTFTDWEAWDVWGGRGAYRTRT
jgi:hypothetical protein